MGTFGALLRRTCVHMCVCIMSPYTRARTRAHSFHDYKKESNCGLSYAYSSLAFSLAAGST